MTNRRQILGAIAAGGVLAAASTAAADTVRQEAHEHPRIAAAIHELEEAIKYMEAAPHDFGGHKAQALADSRAAVKSLREALAFRAAKDKH